MSALHRAFIVAPGSGEHATQQPGTGHCDQSSDSTLARHAPPHLHCSHAPSPFQGGTSSHAATHMLSCFLGPTQSSSAHSPPESPPGPPPGSAALRGPPPRPPRPAARPWPGPPSFQTALLRTTPPAAPGLLAAGRGGGWRVGGCGEAPPVGSRLGGRSAQAGRMQVGARQVGRQAR